MRFSSYRVLVTGASRGLGWVAAQAFAREGAWLMIVGRDERRLQQFASSYGNPGECEHFAADLTDMESVALVADRTLSKLGGIDIILHCMGGGFGYRDHLLPSDQLAHLFQVNIGAAAELNRLLIPGMIERGWGRVIHVGSTAASEACGSVGYNTCKAALAAYVRSLGNALAGKGVVATGINPGAFYAPGNAMVRFQRSKPELFAEWTARRLPRGRVGWSEELLPLLFLLASDDASMMAGSCVAIDAGECVAYAK